MQSSTNTEIFVFRFMLRSHTIWKGRTAKRKSVNTDMAFNWILASDAVADFTNLPPMQYETSGKAYLGRQSAFALSLGSQTAARGLHCTKSTTTNTEVEVTKRAIVAKSEYRSHFRRPPILNRNSAIDIFTTRMMRLVSNSVTSVSLPALMI